MNKIGDTLEGRKRLQQALTDAGYPVDVDGYLGNQTAAAIKKYRKEHGLSEAAVIDNKLLVSLGLLKVINVPIQLPDIGATALDYFLNFLQSKINGVALTMVASVALWITTKFGIDVPPEVQQWVTGLLVTGFGVVIVILRTFFNAPKVVSKMPDVVKK